MQCREGDECDGGKGDDVAEIKAALTSMLNRDTYLHYKELARRASSSFLYSDIARKSIEA